MRTSDNLSGRPKALSVSVCLCVSLLWGGPWEGAEEGRPEVGGDLRRGKVTEAEVGDLAMLPFPPQLALCVSFPRQGGAVHHTPRA